MPLGLSRVSFVSWVNYGYSEEYRFPGNSEAGPESS